MDIQPPLPSLSSQRAECLKIVFRVFAAALNEGWTDTIVEVSQH